MERSMIWYPKCSTCQRARKWLLEQGVEVPLRDVKEQPPTLEELRQWHRASGLALKKFFNTSGLVYRSMDLKNKLPGLSEEEQLKLLASDGMLVKRPILVTEQGVCPGFREEDWKNLLG